MEYRHSCLSGSVTAIQHHILPQQSINAPNLNVTHPSFNGNGCRQNPLHAAAEFDHSYSLTFAEPFVASMRSLEPNHQPLPQQGPGVVSPPLLCSDSIFVSQLQAILDGEGSSLSSQGGNGFGNPEIPTQRVDVKRGSGAMATQSQGGNHVELGLTSTVTQGADS
jgi:hypothetical protein